MLWPFLKIFVNYVNDGNITEISTPLKSASRIPVHTLKTNTPRLSGGNEKQFTTFYNTNLRLTQHPDFYFIEIVSQAVVPLALYRNERASNHIVGKKQKTEKGINKLP